MKQGPGTGRELGFTLVETLVVLAVASLLMGLLTVAIYSSFVTSNRIYQHDAVSEELETIQDLIRRILSQIHPARDVGSSGGMVRFSGDTTAMDFLAPLPQRFGPADIVRCTLLLSADGSLHITWLPDRPQEQWTGNGAIDAIQGLTDASFSYFGPSDDGVAQWFASWKERKEVPKLIRIRFSWKERPIELIAAPLTTAAPCLPGPETNKCLP